MKATQRSKDLLHHIVVSDVLGGVGLGYLVVGDILVVGLGYIVVSDVLGGV